MSVRREVLFFAVLAIALTAAGLEIRQLHASVRVAADRASEALVALETMEAGCRQERAVLGVYAGRLMEAGRDCARRTEKILTDEDAGSWLACPLPDGVRAGYTGGTDGPGDTGSTADAMCEVAGARHDD